GLVATSLNLGHQQGTLLCVGGASVAVLEVVERLDGLVHVAGGRGLVELFVQAPSGNTALLLPVFVASPARKGEQDHHERPADQAAVLGPKVLDVVELFLLRKVVSGHDDVFRWKDGIMTGAALAPTERPATGAG